MSSPVQAKAAPPPASTYLLEAQERLLLAKNYFAWQGRLVRRALGQRVVEVGCGVGNFTGLLLDREAVLAIDLDPECVDRTRQRYRERANLQVILCDADTDSLAALSGFQADSCVCLNVLEHIKQDGRALRNMAGMLEGGGVIVLLLPAFQALYGPVDRNLGHYRRYDRGSMRRLAREAGLAIRTMHYMNAAGFFAWWADARVFRREVHTEGQIQVFDRYVVPLLSRLESFARPPFGQSLFVVLEKP